MSLRTEIKRSWQGKDSPKFLARLLNPTDKEREEAREWLDALPEKRKEPPPKK